MARLCLGYLCLPGFEKIPSSASAHWRLTSVKGYYCFLDYSYAYWCRHLEEALYRTADQSALLDLSECISVFIDAHWKEHFSYTNLSKIVKDRIQPLKASPFFTQLGQALEAARKQLDIYGRPLNDDQPLDLNEILMDIRRAMEYVHANERQLFDSDLLAVYGKSVYKCPRASCKYFSEGFETREQRDQHVSKHDRAFFCSFPTCLMATLGFVSISELQRHENDKHRLLLLEETSYPDPALDKDEKSFECTECDSTFTRNSNLKIHLRKHARSDHRFACKFCNKTFARYGDRTRHQASHLSSGKRFTCGIDSAGELSGGCGRVFNRAENLRRHQQRKRGQICRPSEGAQVSSQSSEEDDEQSDAASESSEPTVPLSQASTLIENSAST